MACISGYSAGSADTSHQRDLAVEGSQKLKTTSPDIAVLEEMEPVAPVIIPTSYPTQTPPYSALPAARRRYILAVVTVAGFLGPLAGGIYLPALPVLAREFRVSSTAINATVSVFMAVFAVAPLAWASWADWRGRRPLYVISLSIYIFANLLLSTLPANFAALVIMRIIQAFGSSAVVSLGAGTVADIIEPKHRATAMSIFLLGPQCGPIIGPVLGGAFTEHASWRWIFAFLSIVGFTLLLVVLLTLPETLRCRVGNGAVYREPTILVSWPPRLSSPPAPTEQRGSPPPKPTLHGYWRLFSYPPIGIVSMNTAFLYATYFSIAVDLPDRLQGNPYNWSAAAIGAGYLAIGLAMVIGSTVGGRINDWKRAKTMARVNAATNQFSEVNPCIEEIIPESRLVDQIWGVLVCAAGCLMYGWFLERGLHVATVLVATFFTGFGMSWVFVTTTAYLTECVPRQASGAFALGNMLRNPAAAVAAVLMPQLTSHIGIGWCFTGWALLDLVLVGSAVIVLRIRGPHWRERRNERMSLEK